MRLSRFCLGASIQYRQSVAVVLPARDRLDFFLITLVDR